MKAASSLCKLPEDLLHEVSTRIACIEAIDCSSLPIAAQAWAISELNRSGIFSRENRILFWVCQDVKEQESIASDLYSWGTEFVFFPQKDIDEALALPDAQIQQEQLAALKKIYNRSTELVLLTQKTLRESCATSDAIKQNLYTIKLRLVLPMRRLLEDLAKANYAPQRHVYQYGQYACRGSILDVWSWDAPHPLRIEWENDEIVSLRYFDPAEQRSIRTIESAEILFSPPESDRNEDVDNERFTLLSWIEKQVENHKALWCNYSLKEDRPRYELPIECFSHSFLHAPQAADDIARENRRRLFFMHLKTWIEQKWRVDICCNNEGEEQRLKQIIEEEGLQSYIKKLNFHQLRLIQGFTYPAARWALVTDAEIFGRYQSLRVLRKQERLAMIRGKSLSLTLSDLANGDYVVHLHHGIARYRGLKTLPQDNQEPEQEAIILEYAEGAKLYVPLNQSYLISRYVGVNKKPPKLDMLGGNRWEKAKKAAEKSAWDYAAKLLKIQAERETLQGYAFPEDDPWQAEFESSFIYDPTPDQLKAIIATKNDMQSSRPMERLICGDVGFGKTEVAIRALFKCAIAGKQGALLAPTTVLAQQHFRNLSERMADYPIKIALLNRFKTPKEQQQIIHEIAQGNVDIIVGTHRLLSPDVEFKDLGLVVIDEEQRFGVAQKEKFKERHRLVHMLSLSATPIPRTLYLSLAGVRDMSVIETPPTNRHPVETVVCPYDERTIKQAIERELSRNGQIYFLHNRITSIYSLAERLKHLVPQCKIDVGHGRMRQGELEDVMQRFIEGKTDLLLATSIIENGIDIPNANTIIIDRADRFGLSDLYQLRGRVGRSHHRGYAYLMLPRHLFNIGSARKRVNAIQQYSKLGDGFKISMRDLELRGAGNLLGLTQSGHITTIGFDLYCRLLKMAVSRLKGEQPAWHSEIKLRLDFIVFGEPHSTESDSKRHAYLPKSYFQDHQGIIENYRRLNETLTLSELQSLVDEWIDCYGPLPYPVALITEIHRIRLLAAEAKIHHVETQNLKIILKRNNDFIMIGGKFPRLTSEEPLIMLKELKKWIQNFITK